MTSEHLSHSGFRVEVQNSSEIYRIRQNLLYKESGSTKLITMNLCDVDLGNKVITHYSAKMGMVFGSPAYYGIRGEFTLSEYNESPLETQKRAYELAHTLRTHGWNAEDMYPEKSSKILINEMDHRFLHFIEAEVKSDRIDIKLRNLLDLGGEDDYPIAYIFDNEPRFKRRIATFAKATEAITNSLYEKAGITPPDTTVILQADPLFDDEA